MQRQPRFEPIILELTNETIKNQLEEMIVDIDYISSKLDDNSEAKRHLMLANQFIFDARMELVDK